MDSSAIRIALTAFYEPEPFFFTEGIFEKAAELLAGTPAGVPAAEMAAALAASTHAELLEDYTRLFLIRSQHSVRPYLSGWRQVLGDDVIERYLARIAELGYEADPEFEDLPEHLAAVMEVYLECSMENPSAASDFRRDFIDPWAGQFASELSARAQTRFYRAFGDFLGCICGTESA